MRCDSRADHCALRRLALACAWSLALGSVAWAAEDAAQRLVEAARAGNLPEVRRLLASGVPADPEPRREPALLAAAGGGHLAVARALLDAGASPDRGNLYGTKPLHAAAGRGDLAFARLLLERGAKPDSGTTSGTTPLRSATETNQEAMVALLLERGASAARYTGSPKGDSLIHAAEKGYTGIARRLLAAGRKPDEESVHAAARAGHPAVLALLLAAGFDPNLARGDGTTPLMSAARGGDLETVEILLKAGADPRAQNRKGETAILIAAERKREKIVEYLEKQTGSGGQEARDRLYAKEQEERRKAAGLRRPEPEQKLEFQELTYLKPEGFDRYGAATEFPTVFETMVKPGIDGDGDYRNPAVVRNEIRIDLETFADVSYERTSEHGPFPLEGDAQPIEVEWRGRKLDGVRAEKQQLDDSLITYSLDLPIGKKTYRVTLRGPSTRLGEVESAWQQTVAGLEAKPDGAEANGAQSSAAPPTENEKPASGRGIPIWPYAAVVLLILLVLSVWLRK